LAGYVICAFCGARMRSDRSRCLRCGELLQAAASAPALLRPEWLQRATGRTFIAGALVSLALLIAVGVFMESDAPAGRKPAAPASTAGSRAGVAGLSRSTSIPGIGSVAEPATAMDANRIAGAAFTTGNLDEAKRRYEEALQKKADDPEALNGLGLVLVRQGQVDDAIAHFTRAAQLSPDKWSYHFNLAHALGEGSHWEESIAEYRAASRLFPDDYATQYNLGMALHKKGDDQGAIPEFERAIALAPGEPTFHLSLGMSLEKTGKAADAAREYTQYLAMDPSAPEAEKLKAHIQALASGSGQRPAEPRTPSAP